MDNLDMEKSSYGALERFIYIFLLPVLFTVVLTGVLLTLFDYNVKNSVYNIGRKIPIINNIVPAEENTGQTVQNPANESIRTEREIETLTSAVSDKDAEIKNLQFELAAKDESIKTLEESVQKLILDDETAAANTVEFRKQLKSLADMYSKMSASKAAPILENLTMPELVLVLYEMNSNDRGRILEKMNPKTAADASIQVKDINESNRAEYEEKARLARQDLNKLDDPNSSPEITNAELARTFAAMTPGSAAAIIVELYKTNSSKAVNIIKAMDNKTRSDLLTAISAISSADAAAMIEKLGS